MKNLSNYLSGTKQAYATRKAKGTFLSLLLTTCAAFTACSNEVENTVEEGTAPLSLNVSVAEQDSRAIVEGTTLPDASLMGVFITDNRGNDYENKGYTNVKYTVSGSSCNSDTEIMLSATEAKVYAYYPYNEEVTDITQIPVTIATDATEQDDYMYATYNTGIVSKLAPNVSLTMNHVLAGIKVGIKKTSDETDYSVQKVTIKSGGMAKSGTMNAKGGSLNDLVGAGDEFSQNVTMDLTTEYQHTDVMYFLPTGKAATLRFVVTIAGTDYVVVTSSATLQQGNIYIYTLNFDNESVEAALKLGTVSVTAFKSSSATGGNLYPRTPSHGEVYAVNADGELISADFADETCIAAALIVGEHKFWIEKNESNNPAYGGQTVLYWDKSFANLPELTNYSVTGGGGNSNSGYLLQANWTYNDSPYLSADYTTWTTGTLSDFNGKTNTGYIVASSSDAQDMGTVLKNFNESTDGQNQGKSDWYIPACGQLSLIYMNMNDLNTVLNAIGGKPLSDSSYWSSSEYSSNSAWYVYFYSGKVSGNDMKNSRVQVRFVRDIE